MAILNTGIYSYRPVSPESLYSLAGWVRDNNIPNPIPSSSLHCTVINSSNKFLGYIVDSTPVTVHPFSFSMEMMNTALAVVFQSSTLQKQHDFAISMGATHEYQTFHPHISLSYAIPLDFPLWNLKPPFFQIDLDPEQYNVS